MYTQENRLLAVDTPLGRNELLLTGFHGREQLSGLFAFELKMFSERHDISFKDIIGKNVSVSIMHADGSKRYFNGLIASFSQASDDKIHSAPLFSSYSATMMPWFWLLTRTADSRIFQKLSVPDIVEKIFSEYGFTNHSLRLQGSYEPRDYAVQYRETDFNFISRLLEEEGIYYFFEHDEKRHTMVLADSPTEHKPCPNKAFARFLITGGSGEAEDIITNVAVMKEIRAGRYTLKDFNFQIPKTDLKVTTDSKYPLGPGEREIYDYPGIYATRSHGDRLTTIRIEEEEARITTITGKGKCRSFTPGFRFTLRGYLRDDMNDKDFVLTHVDHDADQKETYRSGPSAAGSKPASYANRFECIPFDVPFRPARNTPKPVVKGVQTALVVGPAGEEIYTDEFGRVKVQFHWDREGKKDENSSCWIRVSQVWAGANWGAMYIPRIGHEVIVEFIEGDPDRPIITGRVYHGNNMPPYPLPANKTRSTIKSNSSVGGGGSNEFRFEDKTGGEEIYLHGQKDWNIVIENNKTQSVGADESLSVGHDRTKTVGNDQKETIGVAKELTIGGAYQITVGAAMNETIGAVKAEEIGAAKSVNVGANSSENIGKDKSVNAGKNISMTSGKKTTLTSGDDFIVKGDKKGVIEINDQLTIKVGKASITLKKNGDITIQGKKITTKGGPVTSS